MLASRSVSPTDRVDRPIPDRRWFGGPEVARGLRRIGQVYGLSLLAAVLGLPVLAAGLITSNNCQLHGVGCSGRLVYGVIGAVVLAALVQLVLLLHFGLGWLCWAAAAAMTATVLLNQHQPLLVLAAALVAPATGGWVSEPAAVDRHPVGHRLLRLLVLAALLLGALLPTLLG